MPYLTMGFVQGPTLAAELKRLGPCPPLYATRMVRAVAEAMQYAHDHGVIHRDLKPGNVLLTADHQPVVTDFGLAVRLDHDEPADGVISGTPHYMAPEQWTADAAAIGERTDVFALGVILFEMLTGRVPFDGTAHQVRDKVLREPLPPVQAFRTDVPPELARIVAKATARNPADRFPGIAAFAEALTHYLRSEKPAPQKSRVRVFWLVATPAVLVLGAVTLWNVLPARGVMERSFLAYLTSPLYLGLGVLLLVLWRRRYSRKDAPARARQKFRWVLWLVLVPTGVMLTGGLWMWGINVVGPSAWRERTLANRQSGTLTSQEREQWVLELLQEGEVLAGRDMPEAALEKYAEAANVDPNEPRPHWVRAELLERLGRDEEAVAAWGEAIRLDRDKYAQYRQQRAGLLVRMKRFPDALADIKQLQKTPQLEGDCLLLRGEIRYEQKDHKAALADLDRAIELPDFWVFDQGGNHRQGKPAAHYMRALTRAALGDQKGAEADMAVAKKNQDRLPTRFREAGDRDDWKLPDPPIPPAPPPGK